MTWANNTMLFDQLHLKKKMVMQDCLLILILFWRYNHSYNVVCENIPLIVIKGTSVFTLISPGDFQSSLYFWKKKQNKNITYLLCLLLPHLKMYSQIVWINIFKLGGYFRLDCHVISMVSSAATVFCLFFLCRLLWWRSCCISPGSHYGNRCSCSWVVYGSFRGNLVPVKCGSQGVNHFKWPH